MRCKNCYRECGPARFVTEFGLIIAPVYCEERHGGMYQTIMELHAQAEGENQAKPAHLNVGGGLGKERRETPEEREARLAADRKKQDDKKAARKKLRGPKKQKGDKKKGKKDGGKGKKGKPDKNARKNAQYGVTPTQPAPTTNPPTSPPAKE